MEIIDRIHSEQEMLAYLVHLGIAFTRIEHPAVFTCDEVHSYRPESAGMETKNLFLRDERGHFYLVMTDCSKRLDLKSLGKHAGAPKLQFGTPQQLLDCLGITPGSVTVLALANDRSGQVELLVDGQFWPSPSYLCHPLVNTSTLVIGHAGLLRFLTMTGHAARTVDMPARE